ncbi:hypothetical protein ACYOEI_35410, partial [Singulisphaera rosea]
VALIANARATEAIVDVIRETSYSDRGRADTTGRIRSAKVPTGAYARPRHALGQSPRNLPAPSGSVRLFPLGFPSDSSGKTLRS